MKKILILLFCLSLVSITACSNASDKTSKVIDNTIKTIGIKKDKKTFFMEKDGVYQEYDIYYVDDDIKKISIIRRDPLPELEEKNGEFIEKYYKELAKEYKEKEKKIKGIEKDFRINNKKAEVYIEIDFDKLDNKEIESSDLALFKKIYKMKDLENLLLEEGFVEKGKEKINDNNKKADSSQNENNIVNHEDNTIILSNKNSNYIDDFDEYIIPDVNTRYLDVSEIENIVKYGGTELLRLAVNEMFARHGATFSKQKNIDYFSSKSWYYPVEGISDEYIQETLFNEYEKENLKRLLAIEEIYK